ncbi:ABC transporter ATP-binding protein [Sediminispirochaeta bajacaliforniensis]|uniref:ABC transporter ATP-binding protein n=1 Tax=Sediminispirochaeta bajacaliforniensis TaxID=148 RepID=UPI000368F72E|nr:ATP-binding cassette domain-containing protein [Sediminispirochaeta bajacaliforniensis]
MSESFLKVEHVDKSFQNFQALKDINVEAEEGEFLCLLGPSGCGKTTLLRIIAGLENPDCGRVFLAGREVTKYPVAARNIGIVFQSYALFPNLNAYDNIAYGLKQKGISKSEAADKVHRILEKVGLGKKAKHYPAQLSGGQQQRVALARALVLSPDILLLDEPLSALDAKVRNKLRKEIRNLQKDFGITTIMVTHDQEEALTMADRVLVMNQAEIIQSGTPAQIYAEPATSFIANFIGEMNLLKKFTAQDIEALIDRDAETYVDAVKIAIRPEEVRVEKSGTGAESRLINTEFRGSFLRLTFETCTDSALRIDADMSRDNFNHLAIAPGDSAGLIFPKEAVHIFRDKEND